MTSLYAKASSLLKDICNSNYVTVRESKAIELQEILKLLPEDSNEPTSFKAYFMFDNHTFKQLEGNTLEEIMANADKARMLPGGNYGMLCPLILFKSDKECRRVGSSASARGLDLKFWQESKENWLAQVSKDPDVIRLLKERAEALDPR